MKVSDCLAKRQFYDGLKSKAYLILKKDQPGLLENKANIVGILSGLFYP